MTRTRIAPFFLSLPLTLVFSCEVAGQCGVPVDPVAGPATGVGGRYLGPSDITPGSARRPTAGGPGTAAPGAGNRPAAPNTGGPIGATPAAAVAGPSTGGPGSKPGMRPRPSGPTTGRGLAIGEDFTRWRYWWEFNKYPFLDLKAAVNASESVTDSDEFFMGAGKVSSLDSLSPTEAMIQTLIMPRLRQTLSSTSQADIVSACMLALAKIGQDHEEFEILDLFRARLQHHNLRVRKSAVAAMGISQLPAAIDNLSDLVADNARGRRLVGRSEVDDHCRSFAAYSLGLIAYGNQDLNVKRRCLSALKLGFKDPGVSTHNLRIALINGLGLIRPNIEIPQHSSLLSGTLQVLENYYRLDLSQTEQVYQSHVPTAISKLLDGNEDRGLSGHYRDLFLAELRGKLGKRRNHNSLVQSAAIALGYLARPYADKSSPDAAVSLALQEYADKGKDRQARNYALMAIGQIGGELNRAALLSTLENGNKSMEKPWAAMALGVGAFNRFESAPLSLGDPAVGRALHRWIKKTKNPDSKGAMAIALGLAGYGEAADTLRELLASHQNQDELAGYLCISLALLKDAESIELIRETMTTSVRRPERLRQSAMALGKLGDKTDSLLLRDMLTTGSLNLAKMSAVSTALGFIGDRRSIEPLLALLMDQSLPNMSRAFAAVALGGIADKELLPWNSKISERINYRAVVETVINGDYGILDII